MTFRRFVLFGILLILLSACPSQSENSDTVLLKVAMDARIGKPFVYSLGQEGGFGGFEVDVCQYLANKLGRKLEIVNTPWDKLPESLHKKKVDLVLNAIERPLDGGSAPQDLAFTAHYYTAYQQLTVSSKDEFTYNLSDLKGKKLGVVKDSIGVLLIQELNRLKQSKIQLLTYDSPEQVFDALRKKELAAALTERAIASWFAWKDEALRLTGEPITDEIPYVGLVHQDNSQLLSEINRILQEARKDTEFLALYDKWHVSIKR